MYQAQVFAHPCKSRSAGIAEARNGILCAVLADGAAHAPRGGKGAELVCRTAADHLLYPGRFRAYLRNGESEEIKYQILRDARNAVRGYMEGEALSAPLSAFDSTLIVFCIDAAGHYLCLNVGDGCVLSAGEDRASVVALPKKGVLSPTCLLSSPRVYSEAKLARGTARPGERFCLATGGAADCLVYGLFCDPAAERAILGPGEAALSAYLRACAPERGFRWAQVYKAPGP